MNNNIATVADMFEWADGNTKNEDRSGWTVTVDAQGKIRKAGIHERVLGVVAASDDVVTVIGNCWEHEWHEKHLRDWAGRIYYEDQTLVTWIRDGRRETHETDRLPPGLEIPSDAEYWTHWPSTGEKLRRPQLNPRFNDGSQQHGDYQGRLKRSEWAIVITLGKAVILDGQEVDSRWIPLKKMPVGKLWFVR